METLGSLCDKLTIVKLKQFHAEDEIRLNSLEKQALQLCNEIDCFVHDAIKGVKKQEHLSFVSNKVFKKESNHVEEIFGSFGSVFSQLADINCELWHEQEKVYEFEKVPIGEKDNVVKKLATLNLSRNKCIEKIDDNLIELLGNK